MRKYEKKIMKNKVGAVFDEENYCKIRDFEFLYFKILIPFLFLFTRGSVLVGFFGLNIYSYEEIKLASVPRQLSG